VAAVSLRNSSSESQRRWHDLVTQRAPPEADIRALLAFNRLNFRRISVFPAGSIPVPTICIGPTGSIDLTETFAPKTAAMRGLSEIRSSVLPRLVGGGQPISGHSTEAASVLRQNVRRRMMMRYAPFTSALDEKHGEARWTWYRLALYHSGKGVKASNYDGVIVDYNCSPFVNRVLVACSLSGREILYDRLSPLGHNGADSSEKNRIRPIVIGDGFRIVGAVCS
jgi:hypothetical protein